MQGRRVYDAKTFAPGDYGKDTNGLWLACSPNGHLGNLSSHQVIEHDDGTITVHPSILITVQNSKNECQTLWHGFLEHGVWKNA